MKSKNLPSSGNYFRAREFFPLETSIGMKIALFYVQNTSMKTRFIICCLLIILTACNHYLVPSWYNTRVHSEKHDWLEYNGITIVAENLETEDLHLVFDIEIKNETDYRIRFYPGEIYYLGSNTPYPPDNDMEALAAFESKLVKNYMFSEKEVSNYFKKKAKKQRNAGVFAGILSASLLVLDAALDAKDMKSNEWTSKKIKNSNTRDLITFASIAAMDLVQEQTAMGASMSAEELHYLPDEILRTKEIYPGEFYRGKAYFPLTKDKYVRLIIPLGSNDFSFNFRWADDRTFRNLD